MLNRTKRLVHHTPLRLALIACISLGICLSVHAKGKERPQIFKDRKGHVTQLIKKVSDRGELYEPDTPLFRRVAYPTPLGNMWAWLSNPTPEMGQEKRPAIIWIAGGWPIGGMDQSAWTPQDITNDQSASDYREAGMVIMYPTFRGAHGNPGVQELYYGELDDLLSALAYLKTVPYVDPDRIYLGGHSAGGTMALLGAAATDEFRAVIALGPTTIQAMSEHTPIIKESAKELRLRDPLHYLPTIKTPTLIIEGLRDWGNGAYLFEEASRQNPKVTTLSVPECDHFSVIAPVNEHLAKRLAEGRPLDINQKTLNMIGRWQRERILKAYDLALLAQAAIRGTPLDEEHRVQYILSNWNEEAPLHKALNLNKAAELARRKGFKPLLVQRHDRDGESIYILKLDQRLKLSDHQALFEASRAVYEISEACHAGYEAWHLPD